MQWIDSHCHLLKYQQRGTLPEVLDRARKAGVNRFLTIGTSTEDWMPYRDLAATHPGVIDYTVGLHPCSVDNGWVDDVSQLSTYFIPPHAPVALGEIGLDYFHLPKNPVEAGDVMILQEQAFCQQLLLALELDCPVIIHSRNAFSDTVRMIDASGVDWKRVVFHCFSYGPDEMRQINERGGRGSFTGIVTYKNAPEVREAMRVQGIERLMLETDCPYLTPEPHRGKPNEPAYLADIAGRCAECFAVSKETLAEQVRANTLSFFNLSESTD